MKTRVLGIAVVAAGILAIFFSAVKIGPPAYGQDFRPAPSYRAATLEGEPILLEDLKGEVVMLNVWATWCVPCREEMLGLQTLHEEFGGDDFRIVGVSIDDRGAHGRIPAFLQAMGVDYDIWVDPDNIFARTFRTIGVPETFLISRDGYVVYQWKGAFDPTSAATKQIVQNALALGPIVIGQESPSGNPISAGIAETPPVSAGLAFSAGLLSFLSPCVLPLIPSYIAFITGMSSEQMASSSGQQTRTISRSRLFVRGGLFVIGFSVIFVALGATISAAGFFFGDYTAWIGRVGGTILIAFGLHLTGLLRIPGVERDYLKMKWTMRS